MSVERVRAEGRAPLGQPPSVRVGDRRAVLPRARRPPVIAHEEAYARVEPAARHQLVLGGAHEFEGEVLRCLRLGWR